MADPGEKPGRPPAYFSTKLRPEGLKKFFSRPGPLLSQGLAPNKKHVGVYVCMYLWPLPPPPHPTPYLKVWIRHYIYISKSVGRSLVWVNGTQNSGLVSFARGSRLPFVQISSIYQKTTAKAWNCYQRWLWRNGTRISVWNIPSGINRTTFSDVPLLPDIFRWNDPKSPVSFTFQPGFPETFLWMVNNHWF